VFAGLSARREVLASCARAERHAVVLSGRLLAVR